MRQTKTRKLQAKIDKIKAEDTYKSALEFIYNHVKWFYNNNDELKREIIKADMIYKGTEAAYSHCEINYEAHIILELKKYYVLIYYEYDYNHDSYATYIDVHNKNKIITSKLADLVESFINDYSGGTYEEEYRCEFKEKKAVEIATEYKEKLSQIKDPFIKKLAFGLSFQNISIWELSKHKQEKLQAFLCSKTDEPLEYEGSESDKGTRSESEEDA